MSTTYDCRYEQLLERFFAQLHSAHPDLLVGGSKSFVIPPPQCLREGNKKTIFANIPDICKRMKRSDEHVTQFLFAELGTSGSVDGSRRLVIKVSTYHIPKSFLRAGLFRKRESYSPNLVGDL